MRGPLLFPAVIVVAVLAGPAILPCWLWVPDWEQGLSLCSVVVETVMVHSGLLPLCYCQWMEQLQLMGVSVVVVMVVHDSVLPAILLN